MGNLSVLPLVSSIGQGGVVIGEDISIVLLIIIILFINYPDFNPELLVKP